jgi:hypothetical protein
LIAAVLIMAVSVQNVKYRVEAIHEKLELKQNVCLECWKKADEGKEAGKKGKK